MESSIDQLKQVTYHREMLRHHIKDIKNDKTRVVATLADGREVHGYMGSVVDDDSAPARVWIEYDEPVSMPIKGVPNAVNRAGIFTSKQLKLEEQDNDLD